MKKSSHKNALKILERIGVRGKENFFQEVFLPPQTKYITTISSSFAPFAHGNDIVDLLGR